MADSNFTPPQLNTPEEPAPKAPNPEAWRSLGGKMQSKFTQYKNDRKLAELKWARNARQYLGIYDPELDLQIDKNRSRAYPKLTRVKCVSMLSRLMNLLFPADDKNWTIAPSPVPNLDQEDLQQVLDSLVPPQPQQFGPAASLPQQPQPLEDYQIEEAICQFAKKRAYALECQIEDQLEELGGGKSLGYVHLCRQVLQSGIRYGCGILAGPFVEEQELRTWKQDDSGQYIAVPKVAYRPRFEFIPIWEYYPDMSSKYLKQMEGQFLRKVMSKHQLMLLKDRPDFDAKYIDDVLKQYPEGNYLREAFETELRTLGVQNNAQDMWRGKYEVLVWHGYVTGKELDACGVDVPEDKMNRDLTAEVWFVGNTPIKVTLDPWSQLVTDGDMKRFHHFIFEEDETFLLGNSLPNIMRDSQMGLSAATRIMLDNASVGRVFELNVALLSPNQDVTTINPDKFFFREDTDPTTVNVPAIRTVEIPSKIAEMEKLIQMFQSFADQETFVGAATGGDMQKGPSEPFRTATGASMLRGDAALPFKDVVRNFDVFTESVIGAIIRFNAQFNPDPKTRGDFTPVARGATSLIAKEVLGIQLDNLVQSMAPEEKQYVKHLELLRERVRVRDMDVDSVVMSDAEAAKVDAQNQQMQAQHSDQMMRLGEAQIKEIAAQTAKELAQAGKNQANAQAASAGVVTDAMKLGLDQQNTEKEHELQRSQAIGAGMAQRSQGQSGGAGNGGSSASASAPAGPAGQSPASMPTRNNAA